jgi:predicted Zn-dependent protease with MMP-like domain
MADQPWAESSPARQHFLVTSVRSLGRRNACGSKPFRANILPLTPKEISAEAARVLDDLPEEFRARLHNIEIVVQKRPTRNQLRTMGFAPHEETIYGLYEGVPLPERSTVFPPILPDKITIFSEPLLRDYPDPVELREQIRLTIIHEIAHYFGMDDDEIDKLGY